MKYTSFDFMLRISFCVVVLSLLVGDNPALKAQNRAEWMLVFSDEFNQRNGDSPDEKYWSCPPRGWSIWNRWISDSKRVAFIKNGKLVCRAIRNTENPQDTALMLTGAVETRNKFSFKYGRIEVRAKTNLYAGNFPAIWLLPQSQEVPHPYGGEIDLFESFGTHKDVYQTVHSHWTVDLKHTTPPNRFIKNWVYVNRWHVYGLEWSEDKLVFEIDGEKTGEYRKSSDVAALANGQWPFGQPFYIILNQSVLSKGSWAGGPDLRQIYETQFDWVRVYKRKYASVR